MAVAADRRTNDTVINRTRAVHETVLGWAESLSTHVIAAADVRELLHMAVAIKHAAATVEGMAATAIAGSAVWHESGDRSAAHFLARVAGTSVSNARDTLSTAERLDRLPATRHAALRGELSPRQSSLISGAAAVDPGAETSLLSTSRTASLGELTQECAKRRAAADPDPDATHARIHRGRYLRTHTDADGAWNLHARATVDTGARIMAALTPFTEERFHQARRGGVREPLEAYQLDALAALAEAGSAGPGVPPRPDGANGTTSARPRGSATNDGTATGPANGAQSTSAPGQSAGTRRRRGPPAKIIVRIDADALLRGRADTGETCEIAGMGPVPVSVVQDMLTSDNPFLAAVVTKGKAVTGVVHLGRKATACQVTALEWQSPTCAVLGCSQSARLEIDHVEDWADTRVTRLEALERICAYHHRLKTTQGWALVQGVGKRAFVPPDDPRHPKNVARVRQRARTATGGPAALRVPVGDGGLRRPSSTSGSPKRDGPDRRRDTDRPRQAPRPRPPGKADGPAQSVGPSRGGGPAQSVGPSRRGGPAQSGGRTPPPP